MEGVKQQQLVLRKSEKKARRKVKMIWKRREEGRGVGGKRREISGERTKRRLQVERKI